MSNRKIPFWKAMATLLRLGLSHFWQQALPKDNSLNRLLQDECENLLGTEELPSLQSFMRQVKSQWPPQPNCPLTHLIADLDLSLADTLLLTLLGEMERSHVINLVVHQLQSPSTQKRPSVHLCSALLESILQLSNQNEDLESVLNPLQLDQHPLIKNHLVEYSGDEPFPLRQLQLSAAVWSALLQLPTLWPNCSPLAKAEDHLIPTPLLKQIPAICELLASGQAKGLIIRGHPHSGRKLLAQKVASALDKQAISVPLECWQQQKSLTLTCHYANWLPVLDLNLGPGETWQPQSQTLSVPHIFILGSDGSVDSAEYVELVMPLPDQQQRLQLWQHYLDEGETDNQKLAQRCVSTAMVSGPSIANLANSAKRLAKRQQQPLGLQHITQARQQWGAERLRLLAQPDLRQVDKNAIVLPPLVNEEMERLVHRAQQRETLWQGLGATLQQTFTAGVRALFIGESGTGKTLAASYIASRLGSPLYRVDLSAVMNKYVGESEKNLSQVLDMAAASDVVLLFDEADSLFGKRSEGKETGERFANMLTHFLLSRIETHPGIVLLTSNNRERIDPAFTRRLDLIVEFPTPGFNERLQLWQSHLGERGPGEDVYRLLASHCDFSGGQLRNVVLSAAVAAGSGSISSADLYQGLKAEYRKLGREVPGKLQQLGKQTSEVEESA